MHTHRIRIVDVTPQKLAKISKRIAINERALQIGGAPKERGIRATRALREKGVEMLEPEADVKQRVIDLAHDDPLAPGPRVGREPLRPRVGFGRTNCPPEAAFVRLHVLDQEMLRGVEPIVRLWAW